MQTSWDKDGDGAYRNLVVSTTMQLGAVVITPPATAGTLVTLAGVETLTNKTLTAPVLNGAIINRTPGASTLAAGTTVADAAALPAGTAGLYPTTGANDAAGVIINVADQVTGRTLMIGNGVSNKILKVYGPSGAVINGAAADVGYSSASGKGVTIACLSGAGNTWLGF